MGKKDKFRKESRKESICSSPSTPKIKGCPIPDPLDCYIGRPVMDFEDGVLFECTNVQCPLKGVKIHEICFREYENHLIKKIATMGSARGWTEQQRRANLWEKKGQSLIAKTCRCRCGMGTTKRDEMAHYNKTLQEQAAARAAELTKRRHVKNQKHLPQLNFPLQRGPPVRDPKERRLARYDSMCSDTSLDEAVTYRRELPSDYRTNSYVSTVPMDCDDTLSNYSERNEVFSEPAPVQEPEVQREMMPTSVPPPITRSYAAAIKKSHDDEQLSPCFNDSGLESKGTSPLLSSNENETKHNFSLTPVLNHTEEDFEFTPIRPVQSRSQRGQFHARKSKTSTLHETNTEIYTSEIQEIAHEGDSEGADDSDECEYHIEYIATWCPMYGKGFNIGEMLNANLVLPGIFQKAPKII